MCRRVSVSSCLFGVLAAVAPTCLPAQPVPRTDDAWQAEHQRLNQLAGKDSAKLIFLGGTAAARWHTDGRDAWKEFYADRAALNLGVEGDRSENVLWRIEHGNLDDCHPRLIVLEIGADDLAGGATPPQVADGISAVVRAVRQKLPECQLLILGLPPRGPTADDPQRRSIAEVNGLASNIADWQRVHFLDAGHALPDDDGTLSETSVTKEATLTEEGYRRWADAIEFKIAELLGESGDDRVELFDGKSLAGWQAGDETGPPQGWKVVDGELTVVDRGDDAQTVELFGDFDFQCEWKVEDRTNSGIFYRWADYAGIVSAGPEYQVTDDLGRKLPPELKIATAATTDMYGPPADKPTRPAGRWNHTRIVAVDGRVEHWLNGIRVLTFDMASKDWRKRLADSKFRRLWPFGRIYEGAFRLQNYGGMPVAYRDLTVRKL